MSTLKVNTINAATPNQPVAVDIQNPKSFRNLIINGAMQVAQRSTAAVNDDSYRTVDRFALSYSGTDNHPTQAQHALTSSDTGPWEKGFRYSYHVTNGDQTSGAGTGDKMEIIYKIEAQDMANSGWNYTSTSSYITFSFWVKSSKAQNFYGYILSLDGTTQNYPFETGNLSANTWTKITKTIPGNSNIQFDNNAAEGLRIVIQPFMGTASTGSVSLNAWAALVSDTRTPNQTSDWWLENDATFEITGMQLEVGAYATDFEHRSFGDELARCQRYYQKSYDYETAVGTATNTGCVMHSLALAQTYASPGSVRFPVQMRDGPTVTTYSTQNADANGKITADSTDANGLAWMQNETGTSFVRSNDSSGTNVNVFIKCHYTAEAEL